MVGRPGGRQALGDVARVRRGLPRVRITRMIWWVVCAGHPYETV
jgi:hypothetical protein